MILDKNTFKNIVANTPLISIDLVVQNSAGEVLLGQRLNRPAQGFWFVPGGRVLKDEPLDVAFRRLTEDELGQIFDRDAQTFLGIYEHFYTDNFSEENFSTHYVVLAYLLTSDNLEKLPADQHSLYRWVHPQGLLQDEQVHPNTQAYFEQSGPVANHCF